MKISSLLMPLLLLASSNQLFSQTENEINDSLYIQEVERLPGPAKVLHAEPLYVDLIRDLGARKGEKEWNIGLGLSDNLKYDSYTALVEYEWAPINRLGFEVELPFTFYTPLSGTEKDSIPSNSLHSIKLATQWTFFVNESIATSMAIGYIHEFSITDFKNFNSPYWKGNVYNPFLVVAKRWGSNFHTLIYTGPKLEKEFEKGVIKTSFDINTSFHYMITGTRNFVGIEFNKTQRNNQLDMVIRPQMRVAITDNLLIGIVAGISTKRQTERFSTFVRLIWEPKHKEK
jgi:hypothetical protein